MLIKIIKYLYISLKRYLVVITDDLNYVILNIIFKKYLKELVFDILILTVNA